MNPRIVPRSEHIMSRRQIREEALRVLYRLDSSGHIAYLAGGCVRDLLLHRKPKDFDVVTDAPPNRVRGLFRNCRLIGRRFRLAHIIFPGGIVEVATFRSGQPPPEAGDGAAPPPATPMLRTEDGMIVRDNVFGTPEEDALRRDFTINALFYSIRDFSIHDYVHGLPDLNRGLIRSIGDPRIRFVEDPVRMIRAIRFASAMNFAIEDRSYDAIEEFGSKIALAARSRLYEEILKLFFCGNAQRVFYYIQKTGLLRILFPPFGHWLDTPEGLAAVPRMESAFRAIDARTNDNHPVSPALLFALIFGAYHEALAAPRIAHGHNPAATLGAAVTKHLAELAPHMQIPKQVAFTVADITAIQPKLIARRPKDVARLPSRPFFDDALDYLRFAGQWNGQSPTVATWWAHHAR